MVSAPVILTARNQAQTVETPDDINEYFAGTVGAIESEEHEDSLVSVRIGGENFRVTKETAEQIRPKLDEYFAKLIRSGKF